jgi:hypothetical protein
MLSGVLSKLTERACGLPWKKPSLCLEPAFQRRSQLNRSPIHKIAAGLCLGVRHRKSCIIEDFGNSRGHALAS